ncbi:hypothetical protein N7532_004097 [Penicillium argentinense]|uniref:Uncharacterized protein n=1 Tax=Penicillium argentinense TaxID=1131581 RepID=A0A9W9FNQ7_9EURO|nr:uncharacterized protein N7532_004097 [Penicillium argentinense]KAJ5103568.1 hypothetical protein N7532_004097 [Penicillium argentinense]
MVSFSSSPQFEAKAPSASFWRQVHHYRPRVHKAKITFVAIAFLLCLWMISSSSKVSANLPAWMHKAIAPIAWPMSLWSTAASASANARHVQQPEPDFWTKFPSQHPFTEHPEDAHVFLPRRVDVGPNDTLPHDLEKTNPHLHLLVPATKGSRGTCRTLVSSMILGYPPATVVGYGHEKPGATEFERMVQRITRVRNYLRDSKTVKPHDFVLVVDSLDTFFQLPPQVLVQRFQEILRENNRKLQKKYGDVELPPLKPGASPEVIQKYSQRVLFGASKICPSEMKDDPGCVSVPQSSLPPDVYGWFTDEARDGHKNRPRWLNPGAVIGQAADLKIIYDEVLRLVEQRHKKYGDYLALTQMYGRQEVVRELERRRTANSAQEWLYSLIGISDASNLTGISVKLETGHRYEYGIGVDYKSELFFNQIMARNDVGWLKFDNVTRSAAFQASFGVPRETRMLLPPDIESLPNPFNTSRLAKHQTSIPTWNLTLDKLPSPHDHGWGNLPLLTNAHSASVPVLAHMNGDSKLRNTWWEKMWFFPWARALLRKYVRDSQGFEAAQSALLGGQEWWDMRGGRGGLWTDDANWITLSEICEGQERDLFDDDLGPWSKENGDPDEPVYNQFGKLTHGKGQENEEDQFGWNNFNFW